MIHFAFSNCSFMIAPLVRNPCKHRRRSLRVFELDAIFLLTWFKPSLISKLQSKLLSQLSQLFVPFSLLCTMKVLSKEWTQIGMEFLLSAWFGLLKRWSSKTMPPHPAPHSERTEYVIASAYNFLTARMTFSWVIFSLTWQPSCQPPPVKSHRDMMKMVERVN